MYVAFHNIREAGSRAGSGKSDVLGITGQTEFGIVDTAPARGFVCCRAKLDINKPPSIELTSTYKINGG